MPPSPPRDECTLANNDTCTEKNDQIISSETTDDDINNNNNNNNNEKQQPQSSTPKKNQSPIKFSIEVSPTLYLPFLVMIDMFAVSLVIPLLLQYFKRAGITSANQRELLSSIFSSSQILGGLCIGAMTDAGLLSRKNTLRLSFLGSAVSYALILRGDIRYLILSRFLVGFVKQTMTVSTALLVMYTGKKERAMQMGRLKASATMAWIVGPSVGALLYKHVNPFAPAVLACGLFLLNMIIASALIPNDTTTITADNSSSSSSTTNSKSKKSSFLSNLRKCFTSKSLASVVTTFLLFTWVTRATSYSNMASYYEELYGIEPHQRGYLTSYRSTLAFIVQSTFVRPLLHLAGGERPAACYAVIILAIATILETQASFRVFILAICPVIQICISLLDVSLKSLVTSVAPKRSLGSVLAALDVLTNAAAVTVPFYRTVLFAVLGEIAKRGRGEDLEAAMKGDPDPCYWLVSSAVHWGFTAVVLYWFLMGGRYGVVEKKDVSNDSDKDKKE